MFESADSSLANMPVTDAIKRSLWMKAGGICAFPFCYNHLDVGETLPGDAQSAVGTVAHIVSGKPTGPRADSSIAANRIDREQNLILLCPNHHKLVDLQPIRYHAELLHDWKALHEDRVQQLGRGYFTQAEKARGHALHWAGGICAVPDCRRQMPNVAPQSYLDTVTLIDLAGIPSLEADNLIVLCEGHKRDVLAERIGESTDELRRWKAMRESEEREATEYDRQMNIDAD